MPETSRTHGSATERRSMSDRQREKKRMQNRISQRCFREKQGSYIKHLERFVSSIENAEAFGSREAAERLQLIHENQSLRESMLRMKKKLLSLGAQMTSLADNDTLSHKPECGLPTEPNSDAVSHAGKFDRQETTELGLESTRLLSLETEERHSDLSIETGSPCHAQMVEYASQVLEPANTISSTETSLQKTMQREDRQCIVDTDLSTFFGGTIVLFSQDTGVPMLKPTNTSTKCPLVLMEAKVQGAMQEFNIKSFHRTLAIRPFVSDLSSDKVQELDNQILIKIVQLAMQAMLQGTRIGGYSYVLCPARVVEEILVWRTHPTTHNRNQVESPFRPTTLQHRFPKHHPAIDLLYWDELRDQLILCEERLEIGAVVYRWLLSSVIEFPDYNVAVSALQLFVFLASPVSFHLEPTAGSEAIVIPLVDITERDVGEYMQGLIASYRLNSFKDRKLPPSMANEYPFLDLSNIVTHYPIISVTQLPIISENLVV